MGSFLRALKKYDDPLDAVVKDPDGFGNELAYDIQGGATREREIAERERQVGGSISQLIGDVVKDEEFQRVSKKYGMNRQERRRLLFLLTSGGPEKVREFMDEMKERAGVRENEQFAARRAAQPPAAEGEAAPAEGAEEAVRPEDMTDEQFEAMVQKQIDEERADMPAEAEEKPSRPQGKIIPLDKIMRMLSRGRARLPEKRFENLSMDVYEETLAEIMDQVRLREMALEDKMAGQAYQDIQQAKLNNKEIAKLKDYVNYFKGIGHEVEYGFARKEKGDISELPGAPPLSFRKLQLPETPTLAQPSPYAQSKRTSVLDRLKQPVDSALELELDKARQSGEMQATDRPFEQQLPQVPQAPQVLTPKQKLQALKDRVMRRQGR